jgi:tetratricopeptide (TPR) repeat protein
VAIGNSAALALDQHDYARAKALWEESVAVFRELGDERKVVENTVSLGIVASREGRREEAATLLRESLEYAQALVDKELAIWCFGELAVLALSRGDADRAVKLMGAIDKLREETGHAAQSEERRMNEQLRDALSSMDFAAGLLAGREMTFEQAVAYALEPQATSAAQSP